MSYSVRRPLPPPRPYGTRPIVARPYYGAAPVATGGGMASGAGSAALGGALGALGGTLGCLLCLAAIGALGLFSCVVAITAYTKRFLDAYKNFEQINGNGNGNGNGAGQIQVGLILFFASLFYAVVGRMQRS